MSDRSDVRADAVGQHTSSLSVGWLHNLDAKYIFNQSYTTTKKDFANRTYEAKSTGIYPDEVPDTIILLYLHNQNQLSKPELDIRITSVILC
nr:AlNc14C180G8202 [Albugo laibachii Nc14]|eukprot:CCA23099.1 AlNc14C180G8202 [Albugo laibachii Nc14]